MLLRTDVSSQAGNSNRAGYRTRGGRSSPEFPQPFSSNSDGQAPSGGRILALQKNNKCSGQDLVLFVLLYFSSNLSQTENSFVKDNDNLEK